MSQAVSPVVPGSKPASSEVAPSKPASSEVAPSKPASSMVARSKPSSSQVVPSKPASSVVAPKKAASLPSKAASPVPPSTVPPCQAAGPVAVPSLDDENEALSEEDEPNLPPPTPSDAAIEARLRRIFKPRADGTYLVSQDFVDQYRDLAEGRSKVLHLFEKSGYNPDCCDMHASPLILLACTRLWPACSMLCPGHFCQEVPLHQRADPGGDAGSGRRILD